MARLKKKKTNISKFRKRLPGNIGLVIFMAAFLYMVVSVYNYLSSNHIAEYEVSQGAIASNNTYRGLILRDETVCFSERDGYVNYYIKNGAKASSTDLICSVDTEGSISSKINQSASSSQNLDKEEIGLIVSDIESFSTGYDPMNFSSVYSFQGNLASELNQSLSNTAYFSLSSSIAAAENNNTFYPIYGGEPGIIALYVDGMENVKPDDFTAADLLSSGYVRENLDEKTELFKADPLYKKINSEQWNIIIAITPETAERLNTMEYVDVRFVKDDYHTTASVSLVKREGQFYANLAFLRGMIRYLSDRYIEIELSLGDTSGLKIPVSAITEKEFFRIPKEYFGEKSSPVLLVREGGKATEVAPNICYADDEYYYIDDESISEGTVIQLFQTQDTYTIGTDKATLTGVYNINKGYASFRYIRILNESNEYAIVAAKVPYSITLYDHIALEGAKIEQNQTVKK